MKIFGLLTLTFVSLICSWTSSALAQTVVQSADGNYYVAFVSLVRISPDGQFTVTNGTELCAPDLIQGPDGALYNSCGQRITTDGQASTFFEAGGSSFSPFSPLALASDGNFYSVNYTLGQIVQITPAGNMNVLYTFCTSSDCPDGSSPDTGLLQATDGNLYGFTSAGGVNGWGGFTPSH
jgi:hypothetical protein